MGLAREIVGCSRPLLALWLVVAFIDISMADVGLDAAMKELPPSVASDAPKSFWTGFVNGVVMIIATEIGDKTFFIAAIMAMNYARLAVFGGAVGALAVMTVLSAALGFALPTLLPASYTHFASAVR